MEAAIWLALNFDSWRCFSDGLEWVSAAIVEMIEDKQLWEEMEAAANVKVTKQKELFRNVTLREAQL